VLCVGGENMVVQTTTTGKVVLNGIQWDSNSITKLSFGSLVGYIILLVTVLPQSQRSGNKPTTIFTHGTLAHSKAQCVISTSGHATLGYERKTQYI
jgi:hypothetical protein